MCSSLSFGWITCQMEAVAAMLFHSRLTHAQDSSYGMHNNYNANVIAYDAAISEENHKVHCISIMSQVDMYILAVRSSWQHNKNVSGVFTEYWLTYLPEERSVTCCYHGVLRKPQFVLC